MRRLPAAAGFLLFALLPTGAQVQVEALLDQDQFLREESVPVKVRITNNSGRTLRFGEDNHWLAFHLENKRGVAVKRIATLDVTHEFNLKSAQIATRTVDIAPGFELGEPGRYAVTAVVNIREWNGEVSSKPALFEVIPGTRLWERTFGLASSEQIPVARKYVLQQARQRNRLMLYARLSDLQENKVFWVFPLGRLVSFSKPEAHVDPSGFLHLLFQTGARSFLFHILSPEGKIVLRQSYDYGSSRPALRVTKEGRIFVKGGVRRVTQHDIPSAAAVVPSFPQTPTQPSGSSDRESGSPAKDDGKGDKK